MTRFVKIIGLLVASLVALLLLAAVALQFVSGEQYKKLLQKGVHAATGRTLAIDGEFDVGIGSHLSFEAKQVRLANPEWGSRPEMFAAERIQGDLALLPLLRGVLDASLIVDRPDLLLETDAQGLGNWVMGEPKSEDDESAGLPITPMIRELSIHQGKIIYRDGTSTEGETPQPLQLSINKLRLAQQSGEDGKVTTSQPLALEFAGAYNDLPLVLASTLDNVEQLAQNLPAEFQAGLEAGDARLVASGTLGPLSPSADLNLTLRLDVPNLATFGAATGGQLPQLGPLIADVVLSGAGGDYGLSKLLVSLDDGQTSASAKGSVAKLNGLEGVDLTLQADTETLSQLLQQSGVELPYPLPQAAHAKARLTGAATALAIEDLSARIEGDGLQATLTGAATNIMDLEGISGNASLQVDRLDRLSPFAGRPLPAIGPLESSARIVPGASGFALEAFSASLNDATTSATLSGVVADLKSLTGIDIDVQAKASDLAALLEGAALELPYPVPQSLEASARIKGSLEQLAIESLDAKALDEGVKITASGNAQNLLKLDGIELDATLEANSLARFSLYANTELPELGPLTGAAKMTASQGVLALTNVEARLDAKQLQATATGAMSDVLGVDGIELDVTAKSEALAEILQQLQIESPVPPPQSVAATAKLAGSLEKLVLVDFQAEAQDPGLQATVSGKADNLLSQEGIVADIQLNAEQLSSLSQYADTDLPPLGPLKATATLSAGEGRYSIEDILAELADQNIRATVTGTLADVMKVSGIDLNADLSVDSLVNLNQALAGLVELNLPVTAPLRAKAQISSEGDIQNAHINAIVNSEGIAIGAQGTIAAMRTDQEEQIALNIEVDSLDRIGALMQSKFGGQQPLHVQGKLVTGAGKYGVEELHAKIGDAELDGHIELTLVDEAAGSRSLVEGDIEFGTVNLADLMPDLFGKSLVPDLVEKKAGVEPSEEGAEEKPAAEEALAEQEEKESEEEAKKEKAEEEDYERFFSSAPLPNELLRSFDADVRIAGEQLATRDLLLEEFEAILTLQDGKLNLQPLSARIGEGSFDGRMEIDTTMQPPTSKLNLKMEHATFREFGGRIDLLIDLDGNGMSLAELMASLDGKAELLIRDADLKKSVFTEFGSGLLEDINPFAKESETTKLICAIARLDVVDGVIDAKSKIAAQTEEVTWFGDAQLDLNSEKISVKIHPKARKGLGLNLSELAKMIYVGGTLAKPSVQLDPKDLAVKYGKYSAAIATGGLSFLFDAFLSKTKANADVCDKVIKFVAKQEKKAARKAPQEQKVPTETNAPPETKNKQKKERPLLLEPGDR